MSDHEPIDLAALGVRRAGASPEVRAFLRDAVARAEDGGAVAVAVVFVFPDSTLGEGYVAGNRWAALLAGITTLQQRVVVHDPDVSP